MGDQGVKDIEIVCMSKDCQEYAESVENSLLSRGYNVDILFPNSDIPIQKLIENIASRGVRFALCVYSHHPIARTIDLNVLQGRKESHNHITVERAISQIEQLSPHSCSSQPSFTHPPPPYFSLAVPPPKLIQPPPASQPPPPKDRLPDDIREILHYLLKSKPLTIMEVDKLIKYLVGERGRSLVQEYGHSVPPNLEVPPVGPVHDPQFKGLKDEMTTAVMEILNEGCRSSNSPNNTISNNARLQAAFKDVARNAAEILQASQQTGLI